MSAKTKKILTTTLIVSGLTDYATTASAFSPLMAAVNIKTAIKKLEAENKHK
jgi:CMP-N-acetylneuraminic acid synthetase